MVECKRPSAACLFLASYIGILSRAGVNQRGVTTWTSREKRRSAPVSASERVSQSKCGVGDSENQSKPPRLPQRESLCCSSVQSSVRLHRQAPGHRTTKTNRSWYRWHRPIANMQQALARDRGVRRHRRRRRARRSQDDALDAVIDVDQENDETTRQRRTSSTRAPSPLCNLEDASEGGRDDRGVPYHAESTLSSAQVLKRMPRRMPTTDDIVLASPPPQILNA